MLSLFRSSGRNASRSLINPPKSVADRVMAIGLWLKWLRSRGLQLKLSHGTRGSVPTLLWVGLQIICLNSRNYVNFLFSINFLRPIESLQAEVILSNVSNDVAYMQQP